jgi:hypothetical protein
MSGIGNRPSGRYEVCRDNRADQDPRNGWYVFDHETGRCIRFFASQANAYSLLRRLEEHPAPITPGTRSPERDLAADGLEDAARTLRAHDRLAEAEILEERARRLRWAMTA